MKSLIFVMIAASGHTVAVAWFSAADAERPEVKVAFSEDGGAHFDKPVRIDLGRPLGRVDVIMLALKQFSLKEYL